jgi:hypothetical protein
MNKSALNKLKMAGLSTSKNAIQVQKLGLLLNQKIAQFETLKANNFDENLIYVNALLFEIASLVDEILAIDLSEFVEKIEIKKTFENKKSDPRKSLLIEIFLSLCLKNLADLHYIFYDKKYKKTYKNHSCKNR